MELEVIDEHLMQTIRKAQKDEMEGAAIYQFMAKHEKDAKNKEILHQMSKDEMKHANVWKSITNENIQANPWKLALLKVITMIFGFTFVVKKMQQEERVGIKAYETMQKEIPQAAVLLSEEREHEKTLYGLLDEERLHYLGSIVLGLNDALVELTGAIAGVSFALADTKLIAMTGIVTGISATLSMAASNYLAQRTEQNENAIKSSIYTGLAYLVTVILLVTPYLLLPSDQYVLALCIMLGTAMGIILFFTYYVSVTKEEPFLRRFLEMAVISLGVALISFGIGVLAKYLLNIDVM